jgi:type I restriction enzyme S subunit
VSVLSAYDDLIENNTRHIRILEEMVQAIYREWFVHYRFPGHEDVAMVESELGLIPEGWSVVPFTKIASVLGGGTPKTTEPKYWGGSIPFFTPKDAPDNYYVLNTEKAVTELGVEESNTKVYQPDTVFITARGTVGKVAMPAIDMAMNQSCYALRGQEGISQQFLLLALKAQVEYLKQNSHGAVFATIITDTFRRMKVVLPPRDLITAFTKTVAPMFGMALNLLKRNQNLRQTRDLLLPKLISGELEVERLSDSASMDVEVTTGT